MSNSIEYESITRCSVFCLYAEKYAVCESLTKEGFQPVKQRLHAESGSYYFEGVFEKVEQPRARAADGQ